VEDLEDEVPKTLDSREEPSGVWDVECRDSPTGTWRDPPGKGRSGCGLMGLLETLLRATQRESERGIVPFEGKDNRTFSEGRPGS
jgi:hypothetical protein